MRTLVPPLTLVVLIACSHPAAAVDAAPAEPVYKGKKLREWIDVVRRRDTCSQLLAISDVAYEAGLRRLERELEQVTAPQQRADHLCLLTIRGEKPSGSVSSPLC